MKKISLITFLFSFIYINAQETSVEKSIFSVQTGFLGIWINNESKLTNNFALRSEIGLDSGIWGGDLYDGTAFLLTPVLTIEPRYYYNLDKRKNNGKNISKNNGNFISLKTSYHPDWFIISNKDVNIISDISFIPTWGIKRNIISTNFNYELGFGIGYQYIFYKSDGYSKNESDVGVNLHLRVGYTF
ncbi:hypothetical protein [Empedobacter tilapiae]